MYVERKPPVYKCVKEILQTQNPLWYIVTYLFPSDKWLPTPSLSTGKLEDHLLSGACYYLAYSHVYCVLEADLSILSLRIFRVMTGYHTTPIQML